MMKQVRRWFVAFEAAFYNTEGVRIVHSPAGKDTGMVVAVPDAQQRSALIAYLAKQK